MKMPLIDLQVDFWSGMAICLSIGLFTSPLIGFLVAMGISIAKESWSMGDGNTPDALNMMSSITGGIAGFLLSFIAKI